MGAASLVDSKLVKMYEINYNLIVLHNYDRICYNSVYISFRNGTEKW